MLKNIAACAPLRCKFVTCWATDNMPKNFGSETDLEQLEGVLKKARATKGYFEKPNASSLVADSDDVDSGQDDFNIPEEAVVEAEDEAAAESELDSHEEGAGLEDSFFSDTSASSAVPSQTDLVDEALVASKGTKRKDVTSSFAIPTPKKAKATQAAAQPVRKSARTPKPKSR
ncbi:hypothetical protein HDU86_002576 [Geranomyces michiganensis]|nr:hypothetical protein HDU86_002576 [Geranomyces michiganensis]